MAVMEEADEIQDSEYRLGAEEVLRRFPEVRNINDSELMAKTIDALRYTPEYFWTVPASTSGKYHHPLCRGKHGLWLHTKMAFSFAETILESRVAQGRLSEYDADMVRAGVLLHDQYKQGLPSEREPNRKGEYHTESDHDVIAAEWFEEITDLPDEVTHAVAAHNGPEEWGGPSPDSHEETNAARIAQLVHTADLLGSKPDKEAEVMDPAEELIERFGDDLPMSHR